jgi:Uma2 family endonuclease
MAMALAAPRYTIEDLELFPNDGSRYELLDGQLLVSPGPGLPHQRVAARIQRELFAALKPGLACVTGPGTVELWPKTHLEPDILVFPARFPMTARWADVNEHWLAVEVLSRGSHMYDREFKRDAYLALGVREVWLVDRREQCVEVCRAKGVVEIVRDVLRWRAPVGDVELQIEVPKLFV